MIVLYSIFFGAGVTAFAYSTIARRVGYSNNKNVVTLLAAVFVFATLVFLLILAEFIK